MTECLLGGYVHTSNLNAESDYNPLPIDLHRKSACRISENKKEGTCHFFDTEYAWIPCQTAKTQINQLKWKKKNGKKRKKNSTKKKIYKEMRLICIKNTLWNPLLYLQTGSKILTDRSSFKCWFHVINISDV